MRYEIDVYLRRMGERFELHRFRKSVFQGGSGQTERYCKDVMLAGEVAGNLLVEIRPDTQRAMFWVERRVLPGEQAGDQVTVRLGEATVVDLDQPVAVVGQEFSVALTRVRDVCLAWRPAADAAADITAAPEPMAIRAA